ESAEADESLPETSSEGEFVVQLGSFSDESNARALAESVEASGFNVSVKPLFSEQGTVWRVRVGPYATRELATEATERLRQRLGRDGLVMTK
ncbi:MAG: SPOR domain-containing protein, partial [Guyparkeria sp.]|uniref:SPOR domain-containing protein n=1 Tax=Guyparkeria sp. TaxID=2035736 RepID=UPI00397A00C5